MKSFLQASQILLQRFRHNFCNPCKDCCSMGMKTLFMLYWLINFLTGGQGRTHHGGCLSFPEGLSISPGQGGVKSIPEGGMYFFLRGGCWFGSGPLHPAPLVHLWISLFFPKQLLLTHFTVNICTHYKHWHIHPWLLTTPKIYFERLFGLAICFLIFRYLELQPPLVPMLQQYNIKKIYRPCHVLSLLVLYQKII